MPSPMSHVQEERNREDQGFCDEMRGVFVPETLAIRLQLVCPSPFRGTRWGDDKLDHEKVVRDVGLNRTRLLL
jgi:hypothetical protein